MRLLGLTLYLAVVLLFTAGCSTPQVPKAPPLATAKGTVQLDGKPMKSGDIDFEVIGQPAKLMKIENGVFSGEVFTGKNTVRIHIYKDGPPIPTDPEKKPMKIESLPERFNLKTTLFVDITEAGVSDLKYEVTSN